MDHVFVYGPWVFDIAQALTLIADHPRASVPVPVADWAYVYGLDLSADSARMPLIGRGPQFDADYAMTTDLSTPLIIATVRTTEHHDHPLLIDGTHRVYRAHAEGVTDLPGHVLTLDETLAIRSTIHIGRPNR